MEIFEAIRSFYQNPDRAKISEEPLKRTKDMENGKELMEELENLVEEVRKDSTILSPR